MMPWKGIRNTFLRMDIFTPKVIGFLQSLNQVLAAYRSFIYDQLMDLLLWPELNYLFFDE